MKAQGLLGGVFPLPGSWSIHTECAWTPGWQAGRLRAQTQGLGKGISHAGERPRGKWPVTFHLGFRG